MAKDRSLLLTICQGFILFLVSQANSEAVVQIGNSTIEGKQVQVENRIINQYLGIPYAEPPKGDLRFRPTKPLQNVPKVYQALKQPPACRQYSARPFPWYFNDTYQSEDCLYLNMWIPDDAGPENPKPVLFFIHSGQFKLGSTNIRFYTGEVLAAEGDIIVVTVSYRLGVFGFLYTNTDGAPGNAGLYDVLEALKWVNRNIASFGGDPTRITIFGESSSAVIVGYLTESPLARGLYSGLIMDSGSPANLQTKFRRVNLQLAKNLAVRVGCATYDDDIEGNVYVTRCLKEVSADMLEEAEFDMAPTRSGVFYPIYGDDILPNNPRRAIFEQNFECKPLLTGNNLDDGSIDLPILDRDTFGDFGEKDPQVTNALANKLTDMLFELLPDTQNSGGDALKAKVKNDIFSRASEDNPYRLRYETYSRLGDLETVCPTVYYAEKCAQQGADVYYYLYVHRYSQTPFASWMGVTLFSEIPYVFGVPILHPTQYTVDEEKLSHQMIQYWSEFVKTGKPSGVWTKYSQEKPVYNVISASNAAPKYEKDLHKRSCDDYRSYFKNL